MILNENISSPVVSSGIGTAKKMGILANGKVFKIISDTLYQNKIGSIVRELSCNAVDGMSKAGKADIPFDLHVPTVFEPWFGVTDTGVGMSYDTVMDVFANYFASTKDSSNDEIGGFGLGAKTPFCYTDSFVVVSCYNGTRTTYSAMMNEQGEPTVTVMGEEETVDGNGIEVRMDVEQNDIRKFIQEISNQLRFFPVKPNLSSEIEIQEINYQDGELDRVRVPHNLHGLWVVQGGVGYPLNLSLITDKLSESERKFFEINERLVMFFNIGDIEVIPSREAISYGKNTIDNIKALIAASVPVMTQSYVDKANSFTSAIDMAAWLSESTTTRAMLALADYDYTKAQAFDGINVRWSYGRPEFVMSVKFSFKQNPAILTTYVLNYANRKNFMRPDNNGEFSWRVESLPIVFVRDKCVSGVGRLKKFREENFSSRDFMVIEHPNGAEYVDDAFVEILKKQCPFLDIRLVSSLDVPEKSDTQKLGTPVVYQKPGSRDFGSIAKWNRVYDEEELEGGYYLEFDTYPFIKDNLNSEETELFAMMDSAKMFDKPIIAIRSSKIDLIKDNPLFVPLKDHIKVLAAETQKELFKSTLKLNRYIDAKRVLEKVNDYSTRTGLYHVRRAGLEIQATKRLSQMERICKKFLNGVDQTVKIEENSLKAHLFNEYKKSYTTMKYEPNLDADVFREKYPMLKYSGFGYVSDSPAFGKVLADYITMIDNAA